ncbi:hypothetical protein RCK87_25605, partial [Salmonella enterica subsp. enterica serovar 1,4,[5],12:i:-]
LPLAPGAPGRIEGWTLAPGAIPGLVVFGFAEFPDAGDAVYWGDEAGELLAVSGSAGGLGGSFDPILGQNEPVTLPEALWGLTLAFTVSAV